jgi:hypothetical protein
MSNRPNSRSWRLAPTRLAPTLVASVLLAGTMGACSSPSGADDDSTRVPSPNQGIVAGTLEARVDRTAQTLSLRNTTEFEVGYMVIEQTLMTVALMPPCGNSCPILVQGASATVKYSNIGGYTPQAKEARVLWWTYKRNADGTRSTQGGVNTINITL